MQHSVPGQGLYLDKLESFACLWKAVTLLLKTLMKGWMARSLKDLPFYLTNFRNTEQGVSTA